MKVDASRRRNDPRKLNKVLMSMVRLRSKTYQPIKAERVSSERLTPGSESSSRRVWGQRPGQLAIKRDYDFHGPFLFLSSYICYK